MLVLLAAACHAAWNVVAKKTGGGNHFVLLGSMMVCLVWGPFVLYEGIADVTAWGWVEWGAVVVSSLVNLMFLPAYPWWAVLAVVFNVLVIYAIAMHGNELKRSSTSF